MSERIVVSKTFYAFLFSLKKCWIIGLVFLAGTFYLWFTKNLSLEAILNISQLTLLMFICFFLPIFVFEMYRWSKAVNFDEWFVRKVVEIARKNNVSDDLLEDLKKSRSFLEVLWKIHVKNYNKSFLSEVKHLILKRVFVSMKDVGKTSIDGEEVLVKSFLVRYVSKKIRGISVTIAEILNIGFSRDGIFLLSAKKGIKKLKPSTSSLRLLLMLTKKNLKRIMYFEKPFKCDICGKKRLVLFECGKCGKIVCAGCTVQKILNICRMCER